MTDKQYIKKLQAIADNSSSSNLKTAVAEAIIDEVKDGYTFEGYISDLLQHGCVSGMVGGLIYYSDTHAFYDKHYEDIENLRTEWESETGETLPPKDCSDLKNWFAWFAYEETARQLASEVGLDY